MEGKRERRRRRRGEVSPRPRRGKKRAPHLPWRARGGDERSMEGGRFIPHLTLSLSLSLFPHFSLSCVHHWHKHTWSAFSFSLLCMCVYAHVCACSAKISLPACARVVDQWAKNIGESFFPSPHARNSHQRGRQGTFSRPRPTTFTTTLLSASFVGGDVGRANKYARGGKLP